MKKVVRINITNRCNLECSFCCVYGSPKNTSFIDFNKFKDIIDEYNSYALEVKLEGGEPLLHHRLFLFIEYLATIKNLKKVVIQTNGSLLEQHAEHIIKDAIRLNIPIELKIGINTELIKRNKNHLAICRALLSKSQCIPNFRVMFAVRYLNEEDLEYLLSEIDTYSIPRIYCDIDIFRAYGRLSGSEYPPVVNPDDASNWVCYASDGTYFGTDLEARSEHEKFIISNQPSTEPVFDNANHKKMWNATIQYLSDITFENKSRVTLWILEFQKNYILQNLNTYTKDMISERIYNYAKYYVTRFPTQNYCEHDPFIATVPYDCCAENITREFFYNEQAMKRTTDKSRFYEYKMIALDIAEKIANLSVKSNIKTTIATDTCQCFNIKS